MTEGEYRVGISFNPSNQPDVHYIKDNTARLIDFVLDSGTIDKRSAALAATAYEEAAMWAVKALTKQPKPA